MDFQHMLKKIDMGNHHIQWDLVAKLAKVFDSLHLANQQKLVPLSQLFQYRVSRAKM